MRRLNLQAQQTAKPVEITGTVIYLILYNFAQALGWTVLTMKITMHWMLENSHKGMYDDGKLFLNIFQSLAAMEVVHAALGLVKTNVVLTGFQVLSRLMVTWGVMHSVPAVQNCVGVPMVLMAWSFTEIIRYSYYMCAQVDQHPYLLQYLRYTLFIVLYPLGVTGELLCIYWALPYVKKTGLYTIPLPNSTNMSFDYYSMLHVAMLLYIPIFPQLYMHMFAQRKKIIGGGSKKKEA